MKKRQVYNVTFTRNGKIGHETIQVDPRPQNVTPTEYRDSIVRSH